MARRVPRDGGTDQSPGSAPLKVLQRQARVAPSPNPASRRASGSRLGDVVAVLRALRGGPLTTLQLAERTELSAQSIYRTIAALREAGAPIEEGTPEAGMGRPPTTYRLTAAGLKRWIG